MKGIKAEREVSDVLKGTLTMTVASFLVKLLGLGYKIPLSYILTNEGLGYFNSAYTVYSFFYLISVAGVPKAVTIIISESEARADTCSAEIIYKITLRAFALLGTFLTVIMLLLSSSLADFIRNPESLYTIIIVAPSILFTSISGVARGYLCAKSSYTSISLSQALEAVLKCILGVALALFASKSGWGESVVAAMTVLGATVGTVVSTVYLLIVSKNVKRSEKTGQNMIIEYKRSDIIRRIFRISIPITLSAAALSLTNMIDLSLIMRRLCTLGFSKENSSALYGIYTTLVVPVVGLAAALISPISVSFMPKLASLYASGQKKEFIDRLSFALRLCAIIAVPICVGIYFYSEDVLRIIFDDSDSYLAAPLLKIAGIGIIFSSLSMILNSALESADFVRSPILATVVGAIAKLGVSYCLLGNINYGISGAPIGSVVSCIVSLAVSIVLVKKHLNFDPPIFLSILIPSISSLMMILFSKALIFPISQQLSPTVKSLLSVSLCMLFYFISLFLCFLLLRNGSFFGKNAQKRAPIIIEYDENVN